MRALLVLNEESRNGRRHGERVCSSLAELDIECERDLRARNIDLVIAAGGDGTIVSTIPLALERKIPLAILPLGTFNDLARGLDIPADIGEACRAIVSGTRRRIDLGRVNGVFFVNEASIGVSSRIARRQTPEIKQRFGLLGVAWTSVQALTRTRSFMVDVRYDGKRERFKTVQLTIANSGRFAGLIERHDASIDDGSLDLYSIEATRWRDALPILRKVLRHDASSGDGLRTRRSTSFEVRTRRPHRIVADGEPAGVTPARFEILPQALDVIVPDQRSE